MHCLASRACCPGSPSRSHWQERSCSCHWAQAQWGSGHCSRPPPHSQPTSINTSTCINKSHTSINKASSQWCGGGSNQLTNVTIFHLIDTFFNLQVFCQLPQRKSSDQSSVWPCPPAPAGWSCSPLGWPQLWPPWRPHLPGAENIDWPPAPWLHSGQPLHQNVKMWMLLI